MSDDPDADDAPDLSGSGAVGSHRGVPDAVRPRLTSPERVVALSDGVFAIVLTLLVLEIAVPENLSDQSLRHVLEELRPTVLAWVVSFLITGMYWVAHRDLFQRVSAVTRDLVWLNLLYLLPVSLIPFASSLLGKYAEVPIALQLYGLVLIVATVMRLVLYLYVVRRPALLIGGQTSDRVGLGLSIAGAPIVIYALAMAVAGTSTAASIILYFSVPILYFLLVTLLRDRPGTRSEADEIT